MNQREIGTVIAALRTWQDTMNGKTMTAERALDLAMIATNHADSNPLDSDEIDALCERLNANAPRTIEAQLLILRTDLERAKSLNDSDAIELLTEQIRKYEAMGEKLPSRGWPEIFAKTLRAHAQLFRAWQEFELGGPVPPALDYMAISELLDRVAEELDPPPSGPISEEGFEE
jgi:hypothetical protein